MPSRRIRIRVPMIVAAFALLSLPFVATLWTGWRAQDGAQGPSVALSGAHWTALAAGPKPTDACSEDSRFVRSGCPAAPGDPSLWGSALHGADALAAARAAHGPLWLGAELPVALLREAATRHAEQLVLGWIPGEYRVWVDGVRVAGDAGWDEPAAFEIPRARLLRPQPLQLALELGEGGFAPNAREDGFFDSERWERSRSGAVLGLRARELALGLDWVLLAGALAWLAYSFRSRAEYRWLALFAGAQTGALALAALLGPSSLSGLAQSCAPVFAALAALTLNRCASRVERRYRIAAVVATLSVPVTLLVTAPSQLGAAWFAAGCYAAAALICAERVRELLRSGARARQARVLRPLQFGAGLLTLALLEGLVRLLPLGPGGDSWVGFGRFAIALSLAATLLRDIRVAPSDKVELPPEQELPADPVSSNQAA